MENKRTRKLLTAILTLALVTSMGSTSVLAAQSAPTSQESSQKTTWIDPNKSYDENGKSIMQTQSDNDGRIQPFAGTIYSIKDETYLGSATKLDRYYTPSWGKRSKYTLSRSTSYTFSTKVEGSGTIKKAVQASLGSEFTYTSSLQIGEEYDADKSRDSKLALYVEYDKYRGNAYRVDYEDDFGTVKETRIGTAKYEVPVDSYVRVVYK